MGKVTTADRMKMYAGIWPRYLDVNGVAIYTSLGITRATEVAKKSGAEISVGKRKIYDREIIDRYLEEQRFEEVAG